MSRNPPLCSVIDCPNSKKNKINSTVFYFVPKDVVRAERWMDVLKEYVNNAASPHSKILVCINHFGADAFESNSKKIKIDAVPSIFPSTSGHSEGNVSTIKQAKNKSKEYFSKKRKITNVVSKRNMKEAGEYKHDKDVNNQLCQANKPEQESAIHRKSLEPDVKTNASPSFGSNFKLKKSTKQGESGKNQEILDIDSDVPSQDVDYDIDKNELSNDPHENLKVKIKILEAMKLNLMEEQEKLQKEDCEVSRELFQIRKELKRKKEERKTLPNQEIEVLKKCFSPTQIRLLTEQYKSRWSLDDLAMAYTISSLGSRNFYEYLRTNLKYPLPAISNINRCYRSKYRTKNKKKDMKEESKKI